MAIFKRNSTIEKKKDAVNPVANVVDYDPKNPPLDGGVNFSMKELYGNNDLLNAFSDSASFSDETLESEKCDDEYNPNLFNRWRDVYTAWIGNWKLVTENEELEYLTLYMKHALFMSNSFCLYRDFEGRFFVGSVEAQATDYKGRVIEGQFIKYNLLDFKKENNKTIIINEKNYKHFVNCSLGVFKVPIFVSISYDINVRSYIQNFKQANLRASSVNVVIPVKGGGIKAVKDFFRNVFNLNKKVPSPVQVLPVGEDSKGKIVSNSVKMENPIPVTTPYRGLELMKDYDFMTKEIFRKAGLRTDITSKNGESYSERNTTNQVESSNTYFDASENYILEGLRKFEMDCKEFLNINLKWVPIYKLEKEQEEKKEKEKAENDKPKEL